MHDMEPELPVQIGAKTNAMLTVYKFEIHITRNNACICQDFALLMLNKSETKKSSNQNIKAELVLQFINWIGF